MPDPIRQTLLRYIHVRAAVLRPKSVESLINDLLPFAEYLTAHHPERHQPARSSTAATSRATWTGIAPGAGAVGGPPRAPGAPSPPRWPSRQC